MTKALPLRGPSSTQSRVADRNFLSATVAGRIRERVEKLRLLMVLGAPSGFQQRVADFMGYRKERISREKQGVERLSVELLLAEIEGHRAEGRGDEADKLLREFTAGQPSRTPVIRLRDGQYLLEFE